MSVSTRKQSRLSRLVPLLVVLALLAAGALAYYKTSGFLDANGTWYGPARVTSGGVTVSIETYLDVSTSLTGQISGKGALCLPLPFNQTATGGFSLTGQRAFTLWGHGPQPPVTLNIGESVQAILGISVPVGPRLQLRGDATSSRFRLTGGDRNTATSLDLRHGTQAAYMSACHKLAPLG